MKVKAVWTYNEVQREKRETVKDAIAFMQHIFVWYLRDELGFGHDRLYRALKWCDSRAGEHMSGDGEVKLSDVHDMLLKECGINIHYNNERMR